MRRTKEQFEEVDVRQIEAKAGVQPELPFQPLLADFEKFPIDCFPDAVRDYVIQQAANLDCDRATVAIPVLSVLASSIGGPRRIRLKRSWTEPSVLWTAVVANGEACASPPIDAAVEPVEDRGQGSGDRGQESLSGSEPVPVAVRQAGCLSHGSDSGDSGSQCSPVPYIPYIPSVPSVPFLPAGEDASAEPRGRAGQCLKRVSDPQNQEKGSDPVFRQSGRSLTRDWDMPSVIRRLTQQPRGLIVRCDELDGWLGRPNACGSRRISDESRWLELHGGRSLVVERRAGRQQTLHLPHATVSLTGTIQPNTLGQKFLKSRIPCGLSSRLLLAYPPPGPRGWTDDDVDEPVAEDYASVVYRLLSLEFNPGSAGASPSQNMEPGLVDLSPEAKERFIQFMNTVADEQDDIDELLAPWFANLPGHAARLALVLHLARWGAGESVDPCVCDAISMQRGIRLARWFGREARRVVALLSVRPDDLEQQKLIEWVHRRGGVATPDQLHRAQPRKYPTDQAAVEAMDRLADTGIVVWVNLAQPCGPPRHAISLGSSFVVNVPRGTAEGMREK